jgi:hypothetical protein
MLNPAFGEREPDPRDLRTNIAEAENTEGLTLQTVAHRALPAAGT